MKPFVFLPGTLCDERLWKYQSSIFKKHSIVNLRVQETLDAMLNSVSEVPYPQFILVGFSMGGYVAQEYTLRFPERVSALVILGSSSEGYPQGEKEVVLKALPLIERGLFKGLTDRRLREFLHPSSFEDLDIRNLIKSMAGHDASKVYQRQLKATLDRRNLSKEIAQIKCPFIAVAGKEDQIVPVGSVLRIEKFAPHAEVHVFEKCGHFIPLEQPDKVNELLSQFI